MKTILIAAAIVLLARQAGARWAELNFSPDSTNQYGFTVTAVPADVTNGIQFTVSINSTFTNDIPTRLEQIRVHKLSTGELPVSAITITTDTSWARFVFVIPSNELDSAEFMWTRGYEGFYKKLGGSFQRINLKKYYEHYKTTQK